MDVPVNVPIDDPNADTEWFGPGLDASITMCKANIVIHPRNDILRKHGIIPEKPPSPTPLIEEALLSARQLAHDNRLEDKDLDELAALEDDEDEAILRSYRLVSVPRQPMAGLNMR